MVQRDCLLEEVECRANDIWRMCNTWIVDEKMLQLKWFNSRFIFFFSAFVIVIANAVFVIGKEFRREREKTHTIKHVKSVLRDETCYSIV